MSPVFAIIDAPIIAGIVVVALILFGAERLPKLARSMGQAKKEFERHLPESPRRPRTARQSHRPRRRPRPPLLRRPRRRHPPRSRLRSRPVEAGCSTDLTFDRP
jgi:TatA/E family protein of Tat protein translocase